MSTTDAVRETLARNGFEPNDVAVRGETVTFGGGQFALWIGPPSDPRLQEHPTVWLYRADWWHGPGEAVDAIDAIMELVYDAAPEREWELDLTSACTWCGDVLGRSPSGDFCSEKCQTGWHAVATALPNLPDFVTKPRVPA